VSVGPAGSSSPAAAPLAGRASATIAQTRSPSESPRGKGLGGGPRGRSPSGQRAPPSHRALLRRCARGPGSAVPPRSWARVREVAPSAHHVDDVLGRRSASWRSRSEAGSRDGCRSGSRTDWASARSAGRRGRGRSPAAPARPRPRRPRLRPRPAAAEKPGDGDRGERQNQQHGDHHGRAGAHKQERCRPYGVSSLPFGVDGESSVAGDPERASETRRSTSVLSVDHCSGFSRKASAPAAKLCARTSPAR
jgi:hypothetical protein